MTTDTPRPALPIWDLALLLHSSPAAETAGFEVRETPARPSSESQALVPVGGDPYRSAIVPAKPRGAGLELAWREDQTVSRFIQVVLTMVAGVAGLGALVMTGHVAPAVLIALVLPAVLVGGGFIALRSHARRRLRADDAGLHWRPTAGRLPRRAMHLPRAELAQLCVRAAATPEGDDAWRIVPQAPGFVVCARDAAGREHEIAAVETAERARWIAARIAAHLGLADDPGPVSGPASTPAARGC